MNTIHSHFYSAVAPRRVMSDGTIWKQCECGHWTIHYSPLLLTVYPGGSMYNEEHELWRGLGFALLFTLLLSLFGWLIWMTV